MQTLTTSTQRRLVNVSFDQLEPLFERYGITRVADITGLDRIGVPVTTVTRPNSPTISINSGKGLTLKDAVISGVMEALEIAIAEEHNGNPISASWDEIEASAFSVIPSHQIQRTKDSFFSRHLPFSWEKMIDALSKEEVYVPSVQVGMKIYSGYGHLLPFQVGSNGLASGGCLHDATLSAIYEVIERDAWSISHLKMRVGKEVPKIRLETIQSEVVKELIERINAQGIGVHLFQCTVSASNVFGAYIVDSDGVFLGFGCNLSPEIAAIRALTEACQGRLCYIAGARDDLFRRNFEVLKKQINAHKILSSQKETLDFPPEPEPVHPIEELGIVIDQVGSTGNRILAKRLTPEGVGIEVVRVMIPGYEGHNFENYAPGYRALHHISK